LCSAKRSWDTARSTGSSNGRTSQLVKASEVILVFLLAIHLAGGLRLLLIEFVSWRATWQPMLIASVGGAAMLCALLFALNLA
jgi:fumarate reductase subunit D